MKFRSLIYTLLIFTLESASAQAETAQHQTGLITLKITSPDSSRHLNGYIWYPTHQQTGAQSAHGNAVWENISVIPNAQPIDGKLPLFIFSHGMFGNARNQAWLASALSQSGYFVAAINHPGTSTFLRDADDRRQLWKRPQDISRTINYIIEHPIFAEQVDKNRIFMAGHSLGGFTAVLLAGGRYDPDKIATHCVQFPQDFICRIVKEWRIAKTAEDQSKMSQDLSDSRIAGFAVFDLGGTQSFSTESLSKIERPLLVIGAKANYANINLDGESRALVAALPAQSKRYLEPEGLSHFDFLGVCTDQALDILKAEDPEDVFVCENGGDARREKHQMLTQAVLDFFENL